MVTVYLKLAALPEVMVAVGVRDEVLDKVALPLLTDQVPVYPDAGAVADKTKVLEQPN